MTRGNWYVWIGLALVLALVSACAPSTMQTGGGGGGGGSAHASARPGLTAAETSWASRAAGWQDGVGRCPKLREIGAPPGHRLADVWRAMRAVCAGSITDFGALDRSRRLLALHLLAGWVPPAGSGPSSNSRTDPRYSRLAAGLTAEQQGFDPHRERVRCYSDRDWSTVSNELDTIYHARLENADGFVFGVYPGVIFLAPRVCSGLDSLVYDGQRPSGGNDQFEIATAVDTLAHESMHLANVPVEAQAECYAEQRVAETARRLGADSTYAATLEQVSWKDGYPLEPSEYRSAACANGGEFDLHPDSSQFP